MLDRDPILFYGDADDLTGWTNSGLVRTTGIADPFGGTAAVRLEDDSAAGQERIEVAVTLAGEVEVAMAVKVVATGSTRTALVRIRNAAFTVRGGVEMSFAATTGVLTVSQAGSGLPYHAIALGSGWYLVWFRTVGVVATESHALDIYPARTAVTEVGSLDVYVRSVVVPGWWDNALAWSRPAEGSEFVRFPSGASDSWLTGTDQLLRADARWIPTQAHTSPVFASGWDGRGERASVGCGWADFLTQARTGKAVRFVPDRTICTAYRDVVLVDPFQVEPEPEPDGTRRLRMVLAGTTPFEGY